MRVSWGCPPETLAAQCMKAKGAARTARAPAAHLQLTVPLVGPALLCLPGLTFSELCTLVQAVVIVLVLGAEDSVVMVEEGVLPHGATVVAQEEAIAVQFIAQCKVAILCVACIALPVLQERGTA